MPTKSTFGSFPAAVQGHMTVTSWETFHSFTNLRCNKLISGLRHFPSLRHKYFGLFPLLFMTIPETESYSWTTIAPNLSWKSYFLSLFSYSLSTFYKPSLLSSYHATGNVWYRQQSHMTYCQTWAHRLSFTLSGLFFLFVALSSYTEVESGFFAHRRRHKDGGWQFFWSATYLF